MLRIMDTKGVSIGIERIAPTVHSSALASAIFKGEDGKEDFAFRFDREGFEMLRGLFASIELLFARLDKDWDAFRPTLTSQLNIQWEGSDREGSTRRSLARRPFHASPPVWQAKLEEAVDDIIRDAKAGGVFLPADTMKSAFRFQLARKIIDDYDAGKFSTGDIVLRASTETKP